MKKVLSLVLFVLLLGSISLFADDAKVMPARLGRFYIAPTYVFGPGYYDDDGDYESFDDGQGALKSAFNLGFALEYGIIDWITGAIQWAPGVTIASDVDSAQLSAGGSDVNANGVADLFVGGKIQIIGENAPVKSSQLRFAVGPGVKIPLPGVDFKEQAKNAAKGDDVTASNGDYHVLGAGARLYFDYLINKNFFIDLYSELLFYPIEQKLEDSSIGGYMAKQPGVDVKMGHGYDLTFELEPTFTTTLSPSKPIIFGAGLPINYKFTPEKSFSISGAGLAESAIKTGLEDGLGSSTQILTLKPNVSFFFVSWPLPTEFKLSYSAPIWGESIMAKHSITLQVKAYFRTGSAK
ncbi:hypothetical protein [Treponema primitia]|uniref:hypothetical protein n=1 Tax=Treponema primitia TaxID=88058 RepID=UPI00025550AA|nr:hypothetical protein [Treponema primitia]